MSDVPHRHAFFLVSLPFAIVVIVVSGPVGIFLEVGTLYCDAWTDGT